MSGLVALSWVDETAGARSFTPEGISKEGIATLRDVTNTHENGQEIITFSHRRPIPQNREHLYLLSGYFPVLNSDYLLDYANRWRLEVRMSEKSTEAVRQRALMGLRYAGTVFAAAATDPSGYSMSKAQGIW